MDPAWTQHGLSVDSAWTQAVDNSYAHRLRKELASGFTAHGAPLSAEMCSERLAKLRRRAGTLAPRYRRDELARLDVLDVKLHAERLAAEGKAHTTAATTAACDRVVEELQPLLSRAAGRIPARSSGQTNTERKLELDQLLPALREERKQVAQAEAEERRAAAEAKRRKK